MPTVHARVVFSRRLGLMRPSAVAARGTRRGAVAPSRGIAREIYGRGGRTRLRASEAARLGDARGGLRCTDPAERGHLSVTGGHAPKGMLSERNCVQAAAPAKATTVAMPMAPPVGLTGAMTPMMRSRARRKSARGTPGEADLRAALRCFVWVFSLKATVVHCQEKIFPLALGGENHYFTASGCE